MSLEPPTLIEPTPPMLPAMTASPRAWRPRVVFGLVLGYFALFGLLLGGQGVIWADVLRVLGVSEGVFGTAQLAAPLVALVVLLFGGHLCARFGKRRIAAASLVVLAASAAALAAVRGVGSFVAALVLAGCGYGLIETAMNAATMDWERATGRSGRMNLMHAGFSAGAIAGALAAGAALARGASFRWILIAQAALCGVALIATFLVRFAPAEDHLHEAGIGQTLRLIVGRADLRRLATLGVLGVMGESVAFTWSVIYLQELGAPKFVSGFAFALFNAAMLLGRLINAPLVAKRGARLSLAISAALLVMATLLLVGTAQVWLATAAFVLLGLAVAGVVPTVLGEAARHAPGQSGAVAGGIMAAAYLGFIACPPGIGWLAQAFSLRAALAAVGVSGVLMLVMLGSPMTQFIAESPGSAEAGEKNEASCG
jgi:MFS family permease